MPIGKLFITVDEIRLHSGYMKPAKEKGLSAKSSKTLGVAGSPTWTRTRDLRINRHLSDSLIRKVTRIHTGFQGVFVWMELQGWTELKFDPEIAVVDGVLRFERAGLFEE